MKNFRKNGFTYTTIIKSWKKKHSVEYIKFETGFRNFWERISKHEYDLAKNSIMKTTLSILILIIISSCNRIQYCTKEIHESYNNGYRAGSFHVLDSIQKIKWNTQALNK